VNPYKQLLLESGAVVEGHFVYNSMRHGPLYVNKTAGLVPISHARKFAMAIAERFGYWKNIDVVVGPELGAVTLMAHVAREIFDMNHGTVEVDQIIATKILGTSPQRFEIARDQARFLVGRKVLLVEDILTKGINARGSVEAITGAGGLICGAGVLWNRGGVTKKTIGVPDLFSCIDERMKDFAPEDCPQCKAGVPINIDFGHGAKFLAEKGRAR
jgi:orotate phosphoribosyltransferase